MQATANLTHKQQKFVDEYLVDGNGARAAIAAGYGRAGARVRAHRLTRDNAAVMAHIAALQAQDGQRLALDRAAVIQGILAGIEMAKQRMDAGSVLRGWAELGKLLGFYAPERREVAISAGAGGEDDDRRRFEAMSDAELMAVLVG